MILDPDKNGRGALVSTKSSELTAAAVHDFKNIFANIIGHLELAREEMSPSTVSLRHLEAAARVAIYAQDVAIRILDTRKSGEEFSPLSLARIAKTAGDLVINHRKHCVHLSVAASSRKVVISPIRAMQILTNLIANASQMMPDGGNIEVRLFPKEADEPKVMVLEVEDEGPGLSEEAEKRLFEDGFSERAGGHGMGLAVVKEHVEVSGGRIFARNGKRGAIFRVEMPAHQDRDLYETGEASSAGAKAEDEQSVRILVMDDDPMVRDITSALLDHLGYRAYFAGEGRSCVRAWREAVEEGDAFDLMILDLNVPGGWGGVETLRQLRKEDPRVPVLITSGMAFDPVMLDAAAAGFVASIQKPYSLSELKEAIQAALARGPSGT